MSPASAGSLEVERYIGACLISQNRKNRGAVVTDNKVRNNLYQERNFVPPDVYRQQHMNYRIQQCQDGWAGGMPLISFANHQRRLKKNEHGTNQKIVDDPLTRLAVHTKGAPLIVTKSFNHRKNKVHRNNNSGTNTKVFENSNVKKQNKCPDQRQSNNISTDAVSVTSDESSTSNNSENCLPRIIKPRKRRKKDRKPPLLVRPYNQDGFSTESNSPEVDNSQTNMLSLNQFVPFTFDFYGSSYKSPKSVSLIDRLYILGDIAETPKLHHSFEEIEEPDDSKDINGNQSLCQCRYCDPAGQIWDVDRFCYSPFLTPPLAQTKSFKYPNLDFPNLNQMQDYTSPVSTTCLEHSMSSVSLEEEDNSSKKIPTSRSSSSSSCRDLEVSTEIVTSLNGHRDLEIKFFSLPTAESVKSKHSENSVVKNVEKYVNKNGFVSEE